MAPASQKQQSNLDVDYVIVYRFTDANKSEAAKGFEKLVKALAAVGLLIEVRNGDNCSLLVFVRAPANKRFLGAVYRSRVKDWLYGIRAAQPDQGTEAALLKEPLTEAERYRLVYQLITGPKEEGGADITPKKGEWKAIEAVFPLHNDAVNKEWIKRWARATFLKVEDLDEIRNRFGEKIAFYFAFTQSYFQFLLAPAAFGFSSWVLLPHFSPVYAIMNGLWCVTLIEYWKKQEVDLGIRWGVKGVSTIQEKRRDFKHEKEVKDPITGETIQIFPSQKRLARQLLQIPFAILAALALGVVIATCFGIEIFLSEVYNGPFKTYLVFLPTVLLTVFIPTVTSVLTSVATQLNEFENWDTTDGYQSAMTQKIFILNFITSYLGICLTAFVYVPFGSIIVPYLDVFKMTARPFATDEKQLIAPKVGFAINPDRLRKQVIYFTVTAQIVNLAMETIVPYIKRRGFAKYQEIKSERAAKKGGAVPNPAVNDTPEEADFLSRVRHQAALDVYEVTDDLREMVVQFGYLSLFSVVWPLTACSFVVNNWIELRSDAVKICIEMQRPTPHRADGIGSWLDSLSFLAWLGSITSAALVYLFANDGVGPDGTPYDIKGWALLLTIFFAEHVHLLVQLGVRFAVSKLDSPGMQKEQAERFMVRKRYFEETFGKDALQAPAAMLSASSLEEDEVAAVGVGGAQGSEKITRASLEEDARKESLKSSTPQDRFWRRQRSWEESAKVGLGLIEKMAPSDESKKTR